GREATRWAQYARTSDSGMWRGRIGRWISISQSGSSALSGEQTSGSVELEETAKAPSSAIQVTIARCETGFVRGRLPFPSDSIHLTRDPPIMILPRLSVAFRSAKVRILSRSERRLLDIYLPNDPNAIESSGGEL